MNKIINPKTAPEISPELNRRIYAWSFLASMIVMKFALRPTLLLFVSEDYLFINNYESFEIWITSVIYIYTVLLCIVELLGIFKGKREEKREN